MFDWELMKDLGLVFEKKTTVGDGALQQLPERVRKVCFEQI